MARGRKPKPTSLKVLQGNAGKRKLNTDEPAVDLLDVVPESPEYLNSYAQEMWQRLAEWLVDSQILAESDLHNLEVFCAAYGNWRKAQLEIAQHGITIKTEMGSVIKNPALTAANEASRQMQSFGSALGLTPADRAKLTVPKKQPDNPFAGLVGGKK